MWKRSVISIRVSRLRVLYLLHRDNFTQRYSVPGVPFNQTGEAEKDYPDGSSRAAMLIS